MAYSDAHIIISGCTRPIIGSVFVKRRCRHTISSQQSHLRFLDSSPFTSSPKFQRRCLLLTSLLSLCLSGIPNSMSTLISLSLGCRTGYLLDRISIEEHLVENTFSTLLKELCEVILFFLFESWLISFADIRILQRSTTPLRAIRKPIFYSQQITPSQKA